MKKFLLSLALIAGLNSLSYSQLSLNEFYSEPGCGTIGTEASDWFELYNGTANPINMDCYRLVTVYQAPSNEGGGTFAYVFDLPNITVQGGRFFVFSGLNTFCYQNGPSHTIGADSGYNWNSMTAGTLDASLTRYELVSGSWVLDQTYVDGTDLFKLLAISSQTSAKYNFFLFNANVAVAGTNDKIENAVLFGYNLTTPPIDITGLPSLTQAPLTAGACNSNGTISFASITSNEQVTSASGSDNGYSRQYNGICGTWVKGGPSTKYSPAATNNTTPPPAGSGLFSLDTNAQACVGNTGKYSATIGVNFTSSSPYALKYLVRIDNFPFEVNPGTPVPGNEDAQVADGTYAGTLANEFSVTNLISQRGYYVTGINAAGCYSATIYVPGIACQILPVNFKNFTAARNQAAVLLKWETATEENNDGFALERNIRGTWEEIAYVPSQAANGNSSSILNYQYTDLNDVKGVSQYRVRQVDLNGRASYSVIRAVRGQGQLGKTIVFPNPTSNGKVSVVFEDANIARNVTLVDLTGRIIKQWKQAVNNIQIDNLTPGMYSLRIMIPETGEQSVEKIVVTKQ